MVAHPDRSATFHQGRDCTWRVAAGHHDPGYFQQQGAKIVGKGVTVNAGLYERLMQHQLSSPVENSVASAITVNGRMLRDTASELMRTAPLFTLIASEDERGTITTANPAAVRIFGYSREEMLGNNVTMLMPQPYAKEDYPRKHQ